MNNSFVKINSLSVSKNLADFVEKELLPGLNISDKEFWDGFEKVVHKLTPINRSLIEKREIIQKKIDVIRGV